MFSRNSERLCDSPCTTGLHGRKAETHMVVYGSFGGLKAHQCASQVDAKRRICKIFSGRTSGDIQCCQDIRTLSDVDSVSSSIALSCG